MKSFEWIILFHAIASYQSQARGYTQGFIPELSQNVMTSSRDVDNYYSTHGLSFSNNRFPSEKIEALI
jgi:hypothetical protein